MRQVPPQGIDGKRAIVEGLGMPPELRRRFPGTRRQAPGAAETARATQALGKAHRKLLDSKRKLESRIAVIRAKLESGR